MHYFIRANGNTFHNNPDDQARYIPGEPPKYPATEFNAVNYCLRYGVARIGWPGTVDLRPHVDMDKYLRNYDKKYWVKVRRYLLEFRDIRLGSIVLVPDASASGDIYVGEVT